MSGNFSRDTINGSLGLYVEWWSNLNTAEGYSDVTVKLYVDSIALYSIAMISYITIDNSFSSGTSNSVNNGNNYYREKYFLRECTSRVYHNADGTKSCYIECIWYWRGTFGGQYVDHLEVNATVDLETINKSAPSVSCEVFNIKSNSFEIKGTSSDLSDEWKYSINDGQNWTSFPNNPISNQVNVQITNVQDNTQYNIQVQARKQYNHVVGYSKIVQITTPKEQSPPTILCEVINIKSNSFEVKGNSSDWSDEWKYTIDRGKTWTSFPNNPTHYEVTVQITNLTCNTEYQVQLQARKQYNSVIGYSQIITVLTKPKPILTDEIKSRRSIFNLYYTIFL